MRAEGLQLALAIPVLAGLVLACESGPEEHALDCPSHDRVVRLDDVHYEGLDCDAAIASAESHLSAAYYRKACEQLDPSAGVPARVSDAWVSGCTPRDDEAGGATLQIVLCCP